MKKLPVTLLIGTLTLAACTTQAPPVAENSPDTLAESSAASVASQAMTEEEQGSSSSKDKSRLTDDEWQKILTPEEYAILRKAGTERPFTSPLLDEHRAGTYVTADCGDPVFRSEQKFDSGTGWPSFSAPISPDAVIKHTDNALGMKRTEIRSRCGGHMGHVFTDGPEPTGLRYCMNGLALKFIPDEGQ